MTHRTLCAAFVLLLVATVPSAAGALMPDVSSRPFEPAIAGYGLSRFTAVDALALDPVAPPVPEAAAPAHLSAGALAGSDYSDEPRGARTLAFVLIALIGFSFLNRRPNRRYLRR